MADSKIEWTDKVWNPVTGCTQISPGCDHCYAKALSGRYWPHQYPRNADGSPRRFEQVQTHPERLEIPLGWRKPCRIFVNSMSDLFHEDVPDEFIGEVFAVMAAAKHHTFQVLTKRPQRMRDWMAVQGDPDRSMCMLGPLEVLYGATVLTNVPWPLPNVWLGTSVELDRYAWRANHYLASTPAAVRFVSAEPLLGPLPSLDVAKLDWLITGGESGAGHRPMDLDWVRDLRDRCRASGTAFFHKQQGGFTPKAGGRLVDGVEWSEFPTVRAAVAA